MARKFSKESLKIFNNSIARYNSMLGRSNNLYNLKNTKINKQDVLNELYDTEELRGFTKKLNDYKSLQDFKPFKVGEDEVTKGEYNTFIRLKKATKGNITRERNLIKNNLKNLAGEELNKNIERLNLLDRKLIEYNDLKNAKSLRMYNTAKQRDLYRKDSRRINNYRTNYLKRIYDMQDSLGVDLSSIINKIKNFSNTDFLAMVANAPLAEKYSLNMYYDIINLYHDLELDENELKEMGAYE